jgi:hypothetical protein
LVETLSALFRIGKRTLPALLARNTISGGLHKHAFETLTIVRDRPSNRPTAMGTRPLHRSTRSDGTLSQRAGVNERVLDASRAHQGMLGWDRPDHETKLTIHHRELLLGTERLVRRVDAVCRQFLPATYNRQLIAVGQIPHYRLANTVFTTMYVARNFRTAYHRDANNLNAVMTCLLPLGSFQGGALILPRFRIGIAFGPGDVLFFDPNQLHGNLPFDGERISIALFCGGWVASL